MPLFFIEMGQGLIARPDLRICTSALYSCTLVAGHNAQSGYGGAYHYPCNRLGDFEVRMDMDAWAAILRPTAVVLVHAQGPGLGIGGTPVQDRARLVQWALSLGVQPAQANATAAGMHLLHAGGFGADSVGNLPGVYLPHTAVRVDDLPAGRYLDQGGFTLVGMNRN